MFIVKVQAVIWMDKTHGGDKRRNFISTYVIDDGYSTIEECERKVSELGYNVDEFAFIKLNNMYYGLNMHNYQSHIVITKEGIDFRKRAFQECPDFLDIEEADADNVPAEGIFDPDSKRWQDGICTDLLMFDPEIEVIFHGEACKKDSILFTNAVITFGINYFITEICINTSSYASHVLAHYFSDTRLSYMESDIQVLKQLGFSYYNPFNGSCSRSYNEKNKREKAFTSGLVVPETIKRPWEPGNVKTLKPREISPPYINVGRHNKIRSIQEKCHDRE